MTREKALQVDRLLVNIEAYEALIDEITCLQMLDELEDATLEEELIAVVQCRLDKSLKELEEL